MPRLGVADPVDADGIRLRVPVPAALQLVVSVADTKGFTPGWPGVPVDDGIFCPRHVDEGVTQLELCLAAGAYLGGSSLATSNPRSSSGGKSSP